MNDDNTVTFTPADGFSGEAAFTYRVTDSNHDWAEATVTVTVLDEDVVNHIPVANDDSTQTFINTPVTINVIENDTGLEDEPITVTIVSEPNLGEAIVNEDNSIIFTPETDSVGTVSFRYRVTDSHGEWDEANVIVEVTHLENTPVANDVEVTTDFEQAIIIDVLANDTGLEDEPITITIESSTDDINGEVVVNEDNTITFTPNDGFSGETSFVYRITDASGNWDEATVTVTVSRLNHIPVANSVTAETLAGEPVDIDVLANDTGLEDEPVTVTIATQPSTNEGTAEVNSNNTITFTPANGFAGEASFTYKVTDAYGDSDEATVTVTVVALVVANNLYAKTERNEPVPIDVLENDLEIEGVEVTVTLHDLPFRGTAMVNPDNRVTYSPDLDFVGVDSLTYQVCAPNNNCDQAKVWVEVTTKKLVIPEGFSPDGDGINDYFELIGLEYLGQTTISIYNRWGNLVYRSDDYQNDWNGRSNTRMAPGSSLPTGTYYYVIEVVGSKDRYTGNVFLKR